MNKFPPNFAGCFLRVHNQYRAKHKARPLKFDKKVTQCAQDWAECLAKRGVLCYRPNAKYGENIFASFSTNVSNGINPKDPIEAWYRERQYYNYGEPTPKNLKDVRHFTQMVWAGTKTMGLGLATGADGKMYVVCNYDPRGNVDGEFDSNVMPSRQEQELLEEEAEGVRTIEPRVEVVRSMERLYAVPSEKLRVWSVWLVKVGEIADEWQKWLHAHIDLAVRLADHLRAAEEAMRGPKEAMAGPKEAMRGSKEEEEEAVSVADDGTITPDLVDQSVQGVAPAEEPEAEEVEAEEVEAEDEDQFRELYTAGEPGAKSMVVVNAPREEETDESPEKSRAGTPATRSVEPSAATLTPESKKGGGRVWPIGIPWEHPGPPPEVEVEPEPLPLPRNEEEMRQFLREFTHQATIYRSYYKHWTETADQAVKEIGGRVVMATYKIRGEGGSVGKRRLGSQVSRNRSVSKAKSRSRRQISKSKSKSIGKVATAESVPEPAEQKSVESAKGSEYFTPDTSTSDTPTVIENPPNPPNPSSSNQEATPARSSTGTTKSGVVIENPPNSPKPSRSNQEATPARSSTGTSKSQVKMEPSTESLEVDDWVRDSARAAEPIPYFFYLRAEPDIQIAIEHDDELVIDADPDRESIVGCYKRLFYNLKDKPCKGGKPWL